MSYTLGVSSSSVMQGHFNSPTSKSYPEVSKEGLPQESKDVLVDRLNDLVLRISKVGVLRGKAISTIHAQVDKIDILVNCVEAIERPNLPSREVLRNGTPPTDFGEPSTPTQNLPMSLPIYSHASNCSSTPGAVDKSPKSAAEVAKAAADLASRLSTIVAEFQLRNKESNRIHDWLVAKNKRATQRKRIFNLTSLNSRFFEYNSSLSRLNAQVASIAMKILNLKRAS
ncbi:hypothetical protein B2J93_4297 [Marssonina coronariae]|uniref:Uncharacterized protein n=1 Tax=Diplocarpon coronariae TaxID=2795749 RepID=A0A218YY24_9HELO|nr:hypothetical protein B2J93_4297 [Marssonina coronariae]